MSFPNPPTILDRLLSAFRQILRQEFPRLKFLGIYEYSVESCDSDGGVINVLVVDDTIGLPSIAKVPQRFCALTAQPANDQLVFVMFINGDESRPMIIGTAPTPTNATLDADTLLKLGPNADSVQIAGGGPAAARKGDSVNGGYLVYSNPTSSIPDSYYPGTTAGQGSAASRVTTLGPPAFSVALNSGGAGDTATGGVITTGSTKVQIG